VRSTITGAPTWDHPLELARRADGRIAAAWPKVKADGHAAEVLAALREATAPA